MVYRWRSVKEIEKKITTKTKAIIVVSLYGLPVDIDPIMELAKIESLLDSYFEGETSLDQENILRGAKHVNLMKLTLSIIIIIKMNLLMKLY